MNNKSLKANIENTTLFDGRVVDCRMKAEHKIVWQSLEAANNMWNRVVLISEIVEAFTPEEKALLQRSYTKKIGEAVAVILELLARRDLVFVKKGGADSAISGRYDFWMPPRASCPKIRCRAANRC